ncbi:MAG: Flp pilus assembly complex ATPase component TadA, partial [Proteobacteria bacterium]|nr:Flp pilus assembly complex ATPase component TadA [Pseudomonadota bacterium]
MAWLAENKKSISPQGGTVVPLQGLFPDGDRLTRLYEIKNRIHNRLVERLNLEGLEALDRQYVEEEIRKAIGVLMEEEPIPLNREERARLIRDLEFEILGLGPLEPLLRDPSISDILVNRFDQVYLEKQGKLESVNVRFEDNAHLLKIINKIVSNVGRRIDESSPMVDARLPDGSRVNAIIPPLALDGPILSIRRFSVNRPSMEQLIENGSISPEIALVLQAIV